MRLLGQIIEQHGSWTHAPVSLLIRSTEGVHMQGRLGKFSYTEWLLLLGLLSAAGTVVYDLMTHPLAWTARVEAYHDGGRALLVETSLVSAPVVVRTFPTRVMCQAWRDDLLQEARADGLPLASLTCLVILPGWAGSLLSLIPRRWTVGVRHPPRL
jgi:hypothetical protein